MVERAPIPQPLDADPEDVFWALSTATTLYGRGERLEALKWLRRAAQSASDQGTDMRALELMKAAADLTAAIGAPPPSIAPPPPPRPSTPPPLPKRPPPPPPSRPAPEPAAARPSAPPRPPPPPPRAPHAPHVAAAAPVPPASRPSSPGKVPGNMRRERAGTMSGRRGPGKRAGSSADMTKLARAALGPALADAEVDDLDEITTVIEHKLPARGAPAPSKAPVDVRGSGSASGPAPRAPVDVRGSGSASGPAPRAPVTRKGVMVEEVAEKPAAAKPAAPAASSPTASAPTKAPSAPAPGPDAGAHAKAAAPASTPLPVPVVEPVPVIKEKVAHTVARKGTMQLVDEGFESMLDAEAAAPALAPEVKADPKAPAESAKAEPVEAAKAEPVEAAKAEPVEAAKAEPVEAAKAEPVEAAKAEPVETVKIEPVEAAKAEPVEAVKIEPAAPSPGGLLAQRVAVIAGPSGEARLVRIDGEAVPEGAVVAIVVPLVAGDGERLAKLLGC